MCRPQRRGCLVRHVLEGGAERIAFLPAPPLELVMYTAEVIGGSVAHLGKVSYSRRLCALVRSASVYSLCVPKTSPCRACPISRSDSISATHAKMCSSVVEACSAARRKPWAGVNSGCGGWRGSSARRSSRLRRAGGPSPSVLSRRPRPRPCSAAERARVAPSQPVCGVQPSRCRGRSSARWDLEVAQVRGGP